MSNPTQPLQIAMRIHMLLLREIGQGIDIERMVREPHYARDVLWVCDACHGSDLVPLAEQFRMVKPMVPTRIQAQRPSEWGPISTDFGDLSQPMPLPPGPSPLPDRAAAGRSRGWLPRWLDRS